MKSKMPFENFLRRGRCKFLSVIFNALRKLGPAQLSVVPFPLDLSVTHHTTGFAFTQPSHLPHVSVTLYLLFPSSNLPFPLHSFQENCSVSPPSGGLLGIMPSPTPLECELLIESYFLLLFVSPLPNTGMPYRIPILFSFF